MANCVETRQRTGGLLFAHALIKEPLKLQRTGRGWMN